MRQVDVILIGAGVMSATVGLMLKEPDSRSCQTPKAAKDHISTRILHSGPKPQDAGIPATMVCRILVFLFKSIESISLSAICIYIQSQYLQSTSTYYMWFAGSLRSDVVLWLRTVDDINHA